MTESVLAAVVGLSGALLLASEAALLRQHPPAGVILFGRNILGATQLASLMAELRAVLPPEAVVMVDQEGGRVARLKPPDWHRHPACATLTTERAAWLQGALIGCEARDAGFDVVCAPVLDLAHDGASDVVGDRAFARDPEFVARLGAAMAAGLLAAGVQPVAKHVPGHGRAVADSHHDMPHVAGLDEADLLPFARCTHLPWWMTAHVIYDGVDEAPATLSRRIVSEVIRGRLNFQGLLISDDLAMGALQGPPVARAIAAWEAGCDLALYCPGDPAGTAAVLQAAPVLSRETATRMQAARALAESRRQDFDVTVLAAERDRLLVSVA